MNIVYFTLLFRLTNCYESQMTMNQLNGNLKYNFLYKINNWLYVDK